MSAVNAAVAGANPFAALPGAGAATPTANEAGGADRFLKLLVTQLQNQDPMNPMDNAQITSQMAQINTVSGIEKLNESVKSLSGQHLQAQAVQGAAMIGRQAWVEGDRLVAAGGVARGGFELSASASSVKIEVVGPGERVLDTVDLRAQGAGRGSFQWNVPSSVDPATLSFRVVAKAGTAAVGATSYSIDTVSSVSTGPNGLTVGLARLGETEFSKVKAVAGSDRPAS